MPTPPSPAPTPPPPRAAAAPGSAARAILLMIGAVFCFTLMDATAKALTGRIGIVPTLWGLLFFGEVPDLWTLAGMGVIAGAGVYVWHRETRAA
jgi:drug/metabolite transporter (DMT)-like permease